MTILNVCLAIDRLTVSYQPDTLKGHHVDLWVTLGVLARRWYLTIPLVAAVIFAGLTVANSLKPLYTAEATVRFYCPDQIADPNRPGNVIQNNVFCNDRAIIDLTGDLAEVMGQSETQEFFGETGLLKNYIIDATNPPRLTITAEADDASVVVDTVNFAAGYVQAYLEQLQTGNDFPYTAAPLGDVPQQAEELSSGRIRTLITIIVAGLIFVILLVHIFDALIVLFRRRRDGDTAAETGMAPTPSSGPEPQPAAAPWIERNVPSAQEPATADPDEQPGLTAVSGGQSRWGR